MGFFSSFFSTSPSDKKAKIQHLRENIASHQASIENIKGNMARYLASNAPKHYQDSGKAQIAHYRQLIAQCRADIARLKA
jgi:hypothetical protein